MMRRAIVASGVVALASHASAQVASSCPTKDVCFKLNIPQNTATTGNGDIFFQLSAPSRYEWVALGQGDGMVGANIFVVYTSADGNNVTVSPRIPTQHAEPGFNRNAQVTLLEGSGVSGGKMVANIRCENCERWSGGEANFRANNELWVYAYHSSGGPKNSNDQDANIVMHDNEAVFRFDYTSAKGGNSVNPLLNAAPSGTASCVPRPAGSTGSATPTNVDDDVDDDSDDDQRTRYGRPYPTAAPTGGQFGRPNNNYKRQAINYCDEDPPNSFSPVVTGALATRQRMLIAHGTLAALAFVILFPAGAIAIRLASFPGVVWLHGAFQVFAYLVYVAAFGLGVHIATELDLLSEYHPVIGIVVFALLCFMPVLGFLHHVMFKKHGRRTLVSYAHLWLGRIIITLGIINGGLGLKLADSMNMSSRPGIIAYAVVAGVIWLIWVAASIVGERKRKTSRAAKPPKYSTEHSPRSETALRDIPHPENGHYAPK